MCHYCVSHNINHMY
uniref:Uncharacterized protein n=1 Tax=Rhizophora mucronata TaxID=61149 RepID=A0A2P2R4G9_RHIMU